MFPYHLSTASPWYLTLLALLPLCWYLSFRSRAVMGRIRWLLINAVRSLVLLLLILALADVQMVRVSDRLTVIYLLDQSLSVPVKHRLAMIDYVNAAIEQHRPIADRVGVIVFGRDAAIEIPPIDDAVEMAAEVESPLDPDYTNLAAAMKLAQATFPEDAAKRIVVLSDGNENLGDVAEQAEALAAAGIGIDVVPVSYPRRSEVIVERLAIPSEVRRDQPFDLKVVVTNTAVATADDPGEVSGRLVLSQLTDGEAIVLDEKRVVLPPGKKVFRLGQRLDEANFYTYEAKFIPDRPGDDAMEQNNRATAFTHVRGKGQVLLIEDYDNPENPDEFVLLARRLRKQGLEVTELKSNSLFNTPGDLLRFDAVVLGNVPREHFTDDQIGMLVRNTQQMGAGLVMLGGKNSFGAGGWIGTELEEAMPVDFQIHNAKVVPCGALALMIHACEIPKGNFWQKKIAEVAIKALGAQDYCGVVYWGGRPQWMWGNGLLRVGPNRNRMLAAVGTMVPGDMPDFDPGLRMALAGFQKVPQAAVKHMIIISDGDPSGPKSQLIQALANLKVSISTVSVGSHSAQHVTKLRNIATATGGKFYAPKSAQALPQIFQREARKVARPLVHESETGFRPLVTYPHEMIRGLDDPLPPITGFVLTTKKENPLVEVSIISPEPAGRAPERNRTVLASWTYGLGKAVACTTDAGSRWTKAWTSPADLAKYDNLFVQMVRWSMRPTGGSGKFTVMTEVEDETVRVVVTALDEDDEFLNFLPMIAEAQGPGGQRIRFEIPQTAPGRYVGTFAKHEAGSYFIAISHGLKDTAPIFAGVDLPFSDEFRNRAANEALLENLARLVPDGGRKGELIKPKKDPQLPHPWLSVDTFRHQGLAKATSSQDIWHYLVLAGSCLFFFDVFFRRVQVSLTWVPPMLGRWRDRILRREPPPPKDETIERLRSRKAQVTDRIEQLRSEARFEPVSPTPADLDALEEVGPDAAEVKASQPPPISGDEASEDESYTERLLRAKKKVWDQRDKK